MRAPSLFLCERSALFFFCRFIGFEQLHKHTSMRKNPCLCKYPHKHSYLGLKREQSAEKNALCNSILDPDFGLKGEALQYSSAINQTTVRENLSLLLTISLL